MYVSDGGYSGAMYDPSQLRATVADLRDAIPQALKQAGADAVVVQGKSGIAIAFAALTAVYFKLVVVRKPGENTHGNMIEGPNTSFYKYIVLDDFVSSGETIRRIEHQINSMALSKGHTKGPACEGVLAWNRDAKRASRTLTSTEDVRLNDPEGDEEQRYVPIWSCRGYNVGGRVTASEVVAAKVETERELSPAMRDAMIAAYGGKAAQVRSADYLGAYRGGMG